MTRTGPLVVAMLALCACAMPGDDLLKRADAKLAAEDYAGAIVSYSEFMRDAPRHRQIARVRATEKALEKLLAAQAAIARAQQNADASRRDLAEHLAESDRVKNESDRLKSEVAKLRADLERLRNIDLKTVRPK